MKIIKVIVDKVPYNCVACKFIKRGGEYFCELLWRDIEYQYIDTRPPWCPLITMVDAHYAFETGQEVHWVEGEDQGGFVIEDPEVAKMILNKEGAFISKRVEVEAMYKIVDGTLFIAREYIPAHTDAKGVVVPYFRPMADPSDPWNMILFQSVEFRREDDYWWRYDGELDHNEVLKVLGLQE